MDLAERVRAGRRDDVYRPDLVIPLLFGGIVIALIGTLPPAGWAARARTATALRTE